MTPLGKPLVFYLKYMAEMERLYDPKDESGDVAGLEDAEQVQDMARAVGDAASVQAADFLEECGARINDHFGGQRIATLYKQRNRSYVVRNWMWEAGVNVSSVPGNLMSCGVFVSSPPNIRITLQNDVCGMVVPWLWAKGSRKGEVAVWNVLGGWADSRAGEGLVTSSGTVALARIPIKAQPSESFDVDRDPLIAEVMKTFARIGAEQMTAIASFVAVP